MLKKTKRFYKRVSYDVMHMSLKNLSNFLKFKHNQTNFNLTGTKNTNGKFCRD